MRSLFKVFDQNNNGSIEKDELKDALSFLGKFPEEKELGYIMQAIDLDKNKIISFEEFAIAYQKVEDMEKSAHEDCSEFID